MELLVVIAIIGVLVALLLPAIQAAREAARRSQCSSQLRQLAIGSLNHHDVHKHFQTGGWGWFWVGDPDRGYGVDQPGGWIYNTLTYIEQGPLHDTGTDGDPAVRSRDQRSGASYVVQSPITIINCPSRRPVQAFPLTTNEGGGNGLFNALTPDVAGRTDYAMNSGTAYNEFGQGPTSYDAAKTHNWQAALPGAEPWMNGISYERSQIPIRRIADGTSNTYLIGEKYIPVGQYETGTFAGDNETWCTGFNNDNHRLTGRLQDGGVVELPPVPDSDSPSNPTLRFGSAHSSVWLAAFCDGSVHSISYDVDWQIHRDLGNREDGNPASVSDL